HAALHLLGARAEMRMAGVDVAPGVDDRDHRLARVVAPVVAHLRAARAVIEGLAVGGAVPAVAAEGFWAFPWHAGAVLVRACNSNRRARVASAGSRDPAL